VKTKSINNKIIINIVLSHLKKEKKDKILNKLDCINKRK